jgi:hypothetical protein
MRKIYIKISENTDLWDRRTEIKKIGIMSWKRMIKANDLKEKDEFAFPGAVDENLPGWQQNWHRRLSEYYFLEVSEFNQLVKKAKQKCKEEYEYWRNSMYCPGGWEEYLTIPSEYKVTIESND